MQNDSPPLVTVVVVNRDRAKLLRDCLNSLILQTHRPLEVVVVDNGSSDDSVAVVQEFQQIPDCPVQLVPLQENLGFCAANNRGIERASGEFVALLNNDAEAHPNWVARLLSAFDGRPHVGMAASKILVWEDPRRIDKVGHLIYFDGQNRGRGSGEMDRGQYDTMEEVSWPDGCAAMYRRQMLDQIGGLDEDFFAYADDAELGLRARIAGWGCLYIPDATVRHHRGATLGVRSLRRVELIERNRILLAAKLFPWSLLWLNGAFYVARLSAGMWAALLGKGEISHFPGLEGKAKVALAMLRADWEALRLLPRILRKRRTVAKFRKLNQLQLLRLLWKYRISLRQLSQQSI